MKVTNKMQLYRLIYFSLSALHVSGDVFAHHQERLTSFTVSGSMELAQHRDRWRALVGMVRDFWVP